MLRLLGGDWLFAVFCSCAPKCHGLAVFHLKPRIYQLILPVVTGKVTKHVAEEVNPEIFQRFLCTFSGPTRKSIPHMTMRPDFQVRPANFNLVIQIEIRIINSVKKLNVERQLLNFSRFDRQFHGIMLKKSAKSLVGFSLLGWDSH